jgi:hypothetical protein
MYVFINLRLDRLDVALVAPLPPKPLRNRLESLGFFFAFAGRFYRISSSERSE